MRLPPRLDFMPEDTSAKNGGRKLALAGWFERLRQVVRRDPDPPSRSFRFMSRLIEREYPGKEGGGVCLALASPDDDELSTDALLMLGYCLRSELGSKVLMIDARMSQQDEGLTGRLGLMHVEGFAELMGGEVERRDELVHETRVDGVSVLPAGGQDGRHTPLARPKLGGLLDAAKQNYDHVLVQLGSPLHDTRAVMAAIEVDAVFLLAEENRTFMRSLDDSRKVLLENGVKDVRVVVSGTKS